MSENFNELIKSLQLTALPFKTQIRVLPGFVCLPDEIALIFTDAYKLVQSDDIELSEDVTGALHDLDELFKKMSKNKNLWTANALENDSIWETCRAMASGILAKLNEPLSIPKMDSLRFVEGQ